MIKLIYNFQDYTTNKNGYSNLHKLPNTYTHLHNLRKSLSMKVNKNLSVTKENLRQLRDCYYISNNK